MRAREIRFFYNQTFAKEPGSSQPTPWHQDLSYCPVSGEQVVSLWVALDPVNSANGALEYVRGSHRAAELYRAVNFLPEKLSQQAFEERFGGTTGNIPPDIDKNREELDIVSWELEPGDCVAHHPRLLHGAPANGSQTLRRGYATRWFGDDVRWDLRPGTMPAPGTTRTGDVPGGAFYPVLWSDPISETEQSGLASINAA